MTFDLNSFCSIESHPTINGEFIITGTAPDAPRALWTPDEGQTYVQYAGEHRDPGCDALLLNATFNGLACALGNVQDVS